MFQKKEKKRKKTSVKELSETKINNMPHKEFKVKIIKILTDLEKGKEELSELFNNKNKILKRINQSKRIQ